MWSGNRREWLRTSGALLTAPALAGIAAAETTTPNNHQPLVPQDDAVKVLNPRMRVPLSFIIDDSTCLVNMGHFCTPQFATVYPDRAVYQRDWRSWPREIPDAFVRQFGEWCAEHEVKGKYSVVPNPAGVGWLDRELPGWPRRELLASLKLVRDLMLPNWDIHPEMITHTRVIDIKTGRPMEEISPATMENSYPQEKKSVDELAAYLAYAMRILRNCNLPCEGITTPGGFGGKVKAELPVAVFQSVRDVYGAELPHYFKYVHTGKESTEPVLENLSGVGTNDVQVTVSVPAGTGDWFGGWQGANQSQGFKYTNEDATSGRLVELIKRGEPAVLLCHWPGLYSNGTNEGFEDFKKVALALNARYGDQSLWMKVSEIARYWAAKGLTSVTRVGSSFALHAPFACPAFTVRLAAHGGGAPKVNSPGESPVPLRQITESSELKAGTWLREKQETVVCFDLTKGKSSIQV